MSCELKKRANSLIHKEKLVALTKNSRISGAMSFAVGTKKPPEGGLCGGSCRLDQLQEFGRPLPGLAHLHHDEPCRYHRIDEPLTPFPAGLECSVDLVACHPIVA